MIVVLGRPTAAIVDGTVVPAGLAAEIALAAAAAGTQVELVGSIGDDDTGDAVTVALGRRGVGHAALLRIGGAATVRDDATPPTRLDARDVDLGLRYISTVSVLVVAEPLPPDVTAVVAEAAAYHSAPLIAVVESGAQPDTSFGAANATVLSVPAGDPLPFARMVAAYATDLVRGVPPAAAFERAVTAAGWERRA